MLKTIRAAAFVTALCLGATGSAWEGIKVGMDGRVKVGTGDTRVDVGPNGDVSVRAPNTDVEVDAQDSAGVGGAGEMVKTDAQITLEGTGQKQIVTCENGQDVLIEGTGNSYSIEGECKHVSVIGTSNKVTVESVGRVTVEGTSNVVSWERALNGAKKPKVSSSGVNNKVFQAR